MESVGPAAAVDEAVARREWGCCGRFGCTNFAAGAAASSSVILCTEMCSDRKMMDVCSV